MPASPQAYLRRHGLKPLKWDEVLRAVETRLPPPDRALFLRRHRNFTSYPAEQTCRAFYDFIGARGLTDLLASFRFHRLCRLGDCLSSLSLRGRSVLDLGAGGGYLSGYLREELGADVSLTDWSPESLRRLKEMDFKTFTGPADAELQGKSFDLILCADSLGETNSDEDDWLSDPRNSNDPGYDRELEQRYGFAQKLEPWRPFLTGGSVLLFEPVQLPLFWEGAAASLRRFRWKAGVLGPDPVWRVAAWPA
jgi:SAM-dependent methyltransferase